MCVCVCWPALKAYPNLCVSTGMSNVTAPVMLATCDGTQPSQLFTKTDSTNEPFSSIQSQSMVLMSGGSPGDAFTAGPGTAQVRLPVCVCVLCVDPLETMGPLLCACV